MQELKRLSIEGMHCASCVSKVQKALSAIKGVSKAMVNLADRTAVVEGAASYDALMRAVVGLGYKASPLISKEDEAEKKKKESLQVRTLIQQTMIAAIVGLPLYGLELMGMMPSLTSHQSFWIVIGILSFGVLVFSGRQFFIGAWRALKGRHATMDTLIALGTGVAFIYSMVLTLFPNLFPELARHTYFEATCVILALINFGSVLEAKSRQKTSRSIHALLDLTPKRVRVVRMLKEVEIPLEKVKKGDVIRIRPGEKIPVDGIIIEGESEIDESMLTGEAMPIFKHQNDHVVGGTLNKSGSFLFQATEIGNDTVLAHIVKTVRNAQASKPTIGKLADQISSIFVPTVILIALISFSLWFYFGPEPSLSYAFVVLMTVLIIACPCALGLATPIAVITGVGRAARHGILIRNGEALQKCKSLTTIVFDKTGTLTEGKPKVTQVILSPIRNAQTAFRGEGSLAWTESKILQWAYSLEKGSEHSLAGAIIEKAEEQNLIPLPVSQFKSKAGRGVEGIIDGKKVVLGNIKWMEENSIFVQSAPSGKEEVFLSGSKAQPKGRAMTRESTSSFPLGGGSQTSVYLAEGQELLGQILISDIVKPEAHDVIQELKKRGLEIIMMTGDHARTANHIAKQLRIDQVISEISPFEKAEHISRLQAEGKIVGMVGDGINDAAALSKAHVGFAMGRGTDVSIESADIVLMRISLKSVIESIDLSRSTISNIKQNLFAAFIYNILAIPVAAGVLYPVYGILLNPVLASFAMTMSSLTVVLNASRLRRTVRIE